MSFEQQTSKPFRKATTWLSDQASAPFDIHEDTVHCEKTTVSMPKHSGVSFLDRKHTVHGRTGNALPLTTSKMENQPSAAASQSKFSKKLELNESHNQKVHLDQLLKYLNSTSIPMSEKTGVVDTALEPLEQGKQQGVSHTTSKDAKNEKHLEIDRLKEQLAAAQSQIAVMDHELSLQRSTNQAAEKPIASSSGSNTPGFDMPFRLPSDGQSPLRSPNPQIAEKPPSMANSRNHTPALPDAGPGGLNADNYASRSIPMQYMNGLPPQQRFASGWNSSNPPLWPTGMDNRVTTSLNGRLPTMSPFQRPSMAPQEHFEPHYGGLGFRSNNMFDLSSRGGLGPNARPANMAGANHPNWSAFSSNAMPASVFNSSTTPVSYTSMDNMHQTNNLAASGVVPYNPRPIGTPLSPTALEFSTAAIPGGVPAIPPSWNTNNSHNEPPSTYVAPMEPMNYRRLLDKNASCNWKYIVDKIVCSNDQQASIFLQQKLKIATQKQKIELIDAIIAQAYPLMINRFGNFLVQRCFEHGTPEQIIAIANAIRGNTLNLSMDAFGCHVVQKAFDVVPEEYKATMVHELLRRIPETVIHRYACHVWQKLFELRWSDSPPQIMKYVNEALRGMWHEVALGETGSLVVQNIFENCLEEDKRPCVNEVLASIDIISHGQFGNWCIQHICEHGAPADKSRATDHVLCLATQYSIDQFASKVVEKCLKVGGAEFQDRYLEKICEGRPDRPRMPLIDIAGDQYGNYLIQYILINSSPEHRELVATHIRKHMVSLRGSKFGSRVAMLCNNPALATRPGPPAGLQISHRFPANSNSTRSSMGNQYR